MHTQYLKSFFCCRQQVGNTSVSHAYLGAFLKVKIRSTLCALKVFCGVTGGSKNSTHGPAHNNKALISHVDDELPAREALMIAQSPQAALCLQHWMTPSDSVLSSDARVLHRSTSTSGKRTGASFAFSWVHPQGNPTLTRIRRFKDSVRRCVFLNQWPVIIFRFIWRSFSMKREERMVLIAVWYHLQYLVCLLGLYSESTFISGAVSVLVTTTENLIISLEWRRHLAQHSENNHKVE